MTGLPSVDHSGRARPADNSAHRLERGGEAPTVGERSALKGPGDRTAHNRKNVPKPSLGGDDNFFTRPVNLIFQTFLSLFSLSG